MSASANMRSTITVRGSDSGQTNQAYICCRSRARFGESKPCDACACAGRVVSDAGWAGEIMTCTAASDSELVVGSADGMLHMFPLCNDAGRSLRPVRWSPRQPAATSTDARHPPCQRVPVLTRWVHRYCCRSRRMLSGRSARWTHPRLVMPEVLEAQRRRDIGL